MTTYLTWLVGDGGQDEVPEKVSALRPVPARWPKEAAGAGALALALRDRISARIGVCRADLMIDPWVNSRYYTVVFTRVVKEVRRC